MDRLLFGDNQFFGVNHMSEEKARAQQMRFQDLDAIMEVLDDAYDDGVTTFMCTTHDRIAEVCDRVREQPTRYADMTFFPCMPYAHKYANAMTEDGFLGAIRRFLPEEGLFDSIARGTSSLARKDIEGISTLLVDAEMKMFAGLSTPVIWLQNVVVDLLSGLGFIDAFRIFADHVRTRYDAEPGFITMNLPRRSTTWTAPASTTRSSARTSTRSGSGCPAASTPTATHSSTGRSARWRCRSSPAARSHRARRSNGSAALPNLESIVFGASSRANIASTVRLVDEYWRVAPDHHWVRTALPRRYSRPETRAHPGVVPYRAARRSQ